MTRLGDYPVEPERVYLSALPCVHDDAWAWLDVEICATYGDIASRRLAPSPRGPDDYLDYLDEKSPQIWRTGEMYCLLVDQRLRPIALARCGRADGVTTRAMLLPVVATPCAGFVIIRSAEEDAADPSSRDGALYRWASESGLRVRFLDYLILGPGRSQIQSLREMQTRGLGAARRKAEGRDVAGGVCSPSIVSFEWTKVGVCCTTRGRPPRGPAPPVLTSSKAISQFVHEAVGVSRFPVEEGIVICLDARARPIGIARMSMGAISSAIISSRDALRAPLMLGAKSFVLLHNHPSGGIDPSSEDNETTSAVSHAAYLLGMTMKDHVIVTPDPDYYYSYADAGRLPAGEGSL